jgi:hypothetical protein
VLTNNLKISTKKIINNCITFQHSPNCAHYICTTYLLKLEPLLKTKKNILFACSFGSDAFRYLLTRPSGSPFQNKILRSTSLTTNSRVLLEKLTGSQLVKKFSSFIDPECSLPQSQAPVTCPYPQPARSSPHPHIPLPVDPS